MSEAIFVSAQNTLDLRQRILRPGQPLTQCQYEEDEYESTFHLGIWKNSSIVSNGTFIQQGHSLFPKAIYPFRLRGMATDLSEQKKGLGRLILQKGLVELKKRKCDLLWFNARTSAELFYSHQNFLVDQNIFEIPLIGPHKVMYKWL